MRSSISSSNIALRAMAQLALAFFIALVFACVASEWLLRRHVLPQDTYALHVALLKEADQKDAAFGDSHAARGFDGSDGFVNLAFPSEGISFMAWKVDHYFSNRAPGRVIIQADPHLFSPYRLLQEFKPYPEIDKSHQNPRWFILSDPRHRARLKGYWVRFFQSGLKLESKVFQTENGALLSSGDFSELDERAQIFEAEKRAKTHRLGAASRIAEAKLTYAKMLDQLSSKGAEICLVSYPVSNAYRDAIANDHDPIMDFFNAEAARIGAVFFDARQDVETPNHFRDPDHLNAAGAKAFSKALIKRCFDNN